ncbi:HET-domain-containing protein, partial [Bimuria novae-zelandiae CBS 107.79]
GDQPLKTTKDNLQEHRRNVPQDKIPATIKDALQVAHDLGFRYFWVDSLCLIQNLEANELHTLIAEIPEIYRHAELTIAAYSSHSATQGFLHQR